MMILLATWKRLQPSHSGCVLQLSGNRFEVGLQQPNRIRQDKGHVDEDQRHQVVIHPHLLGKEHNGNS